jgi:hypothetical protein
MEFILFGTNNATTTIMNPKQVTRLEAFQYTNRILKEYYSFDVRKFSRMEIAILIDLLRCALKLGDDARFVNPAEKSATEPDPSS